MDDDRLPARRGSEGPTIFKPWTFVLGFLMLAGGMLLGAMGDRLDPHSTGEYQLLAALHEGRTPALDLVAKGYEFFGGPKFVPWMLVVLGLVLFLAKRRIMGVVAWLMPALGWLPGHFAKKMFPRERPPAELEPVVVYKDVMSFPSGHTGFATSITIFVLFALTMWGLRKTWMVVVGVLVILSMGFTRLYAAAHWYFDVIGGSVLAGGTSLMLWPAFAWLWLTAQRRGGFWAEPTKELPPARRANLEADIENDG